MPTICQPILMKDSQEGFGEPRDVFLDRGVNGDIVQSRSLGKIDSISG